MIIDIHCIVPCQWGEVVIKRQVKQNSICANFGMGYGVLQMYGFLVRNSCEPTRWTESGMGFHRLWPGYHKYHRIRTDSTVSPLSSWPAAAGPQASESG